MRWYPGEPKVLSTGSRADPPGAGVEARSWTFRQTAHSTVAAIHPDASPAGSCQLLKVVYCPPSGAQSSQMALLTFEICRSEKADPSGQAVPARKKLVALRPTELARLRALEAGRKAR